MSDSAAERKPGPSHPDELIDRTIGEFRLLRRLGAGGMAEVYLAEQPSLQRVVALKVLRSDRVAGFDVSMVERFEREARAAAGLNHPHIVQVYQTGEDNGIHYIVQEYVPGCNLSQRIRRDGPPELHQGVRWMRQVAEALQAAEQAGIVHRDIKPENIMLTADDVAKVADFGLAQLSEQADQKHLTQTGTAIGTPLYMSPEQIRGGRLDARSDQYSFGVTCYHMFAGRPPFSSGHSVAVAVQHLQDDPTPLSRFRADLPTAVCDTIHRMMAKNPDDRFATAADMVSAIAALQSLPINASLKQPSGFPGRIRALFPSAKAAAAGFLIATAVGVLASRHWMPPLRLPYEEPNPVEQKSSAAAQFAAALLMPSSESAWLAVETCYPDSDEALYASFQLALLYIRRQPPDLQRADDRLAALLRQIRAIGGFERLEMMALAARALIAHRQNRPEQEQKFQDAVRHRHADAADGELLFPESAPRPLRTYLNSTFPELLADSPRPQTARRRRRAGGPDR